MTEIISVRVPRFLYVKSMSREFLINVAHVTMVRDNGAGRTIVYAGGGNYVVDMAFDDVRAQLAKFGIIHELDPAEEAKP